MAATPSQDPRQDPGVAGAFLETMRRLTTSVVMVITRLDRQPWGLTVSACCSVSTHSPMILVSIGELTATAQAVGHERRFGVSILSEDQVEVARFGARHQAPKYCGEFCDPGVEANSATPAVKNAVTHLDCRVEQEVRVADHILFIGVVERVIRWLAERPLLYYSRDFHKLFNALTADAVGCQPQ